MSEDFHEDREGQDLDSLSERLRRGRRLGALKPKPRDPAERTDAITRRPLDYHQEEETRKTETNRWLENHFGSESGRSGSSHHEDDSAVHTAGGNVITITMSPRPATPEDVPDAAPSGMRHWDSPAAPNYSRSTHKAPPPPPPPKPTSSWNSPAAASPRQQPPPSEEITDSMIAAARARLRSTGRILDDSENNSTPPMSPGATNGVRFSGQQERVQVLPSSPTSFPSPPISPVSPVSPTGRPADDPVFSSRFRSGSPSGYISTRLFSTPSRGSRQARSPSDSPPPPLPATPPPTQSNNVGRSQSFNVTNKNWVSSGSKTLYSRPLNSRMKEFRSEEQLDDVGDRPHRRWSPPQREVSPEPPREVTPPPPPRTRNSNTNYAHYNTAPSRSSRSTRTTEIATQTIARDSATQTAPSPVPPPRTKRKNKPKTYYFGQDSTPSISPLRSTSRAPITTSTSTTSYTSTRRHNQSSPKVERRFRTTKTITPVVVPASTHASEDKLKNRSWHYRSMDELSTGVDSAPRASWTNTIDPRRKPRQYSHTPKEPETQTLPKKMSNGTASPSRTYIFGSDSPSRRDMGSRSSNSHLQRSYGGSMLNVSLASMSSPKSTYTTELRDKSPPRSTRPVLRSHSLNIKPAPLKTNGSPTEPSPVTTSLSNTQRTSSMYRSSPYINLRSPNLIATIARSNSTRRTDSYEEEDPQERIESPPPAEHHRSTHSTSQHTSRSTSSYTNRNTNSQSINNNNNTRNANGSLNHNNRNGPTTNGDNNGEDKRNRFMKGLLTTAPELYQLLHGDEDGKKKEESGKSGHSPPESPPQLIRPPGSPLTSPSAKSPSATAPRIFTFGRGEAGSVKRSPSAPQENNNRFSSLGRQNDGQPRNSLSGSRDNLSSTPQRNSLTSQYHRQAQLSNSNSGVATNSLNRPKFNLKSSGGGSLLYSSSFRNRAEQQQQQQQQHQSTLASRRGSDPRDHKPHSTPSWRDHSEVGGKHQGNVTSNLTRDGAVLIPIRDWNSR